MHNLFKEALNDQNLDPNDIKYLYKYFIQTNQDEKMFKNYLEELKQGRPVQYIIGNVDFYGNIIKVNENVLIPRFCTEELVEKTLFSIKKLFPENDLDILDLCTGSGCIAITLKKELPSSNVDASDISFEALNLAKLNAQENDVAVNFIESDLFANIKKKYHVIISNPPYLDRQEIIDPKVQNNEPHLALYADHQGLYYYEEILKNISNYLKERYLIAFEIGYKQKEAIQKLKDLYLPEASLTSFKDLEGFDRFIFITNIV